jgi:hypothetical protein
MPSELFELAAAISRAQVRAASPAPRPIYDNTACCQRCGRQVRAASHTPLTSAELANFVCVTCLSGWAA